MGCQKGIQLTNTQNSKTGRGQLSKNTPKQGFGTSVKMDFLEVLEHTKKQKGRLIISQWNTPFFIIILYYIYYIILVMLVTNTPKPVTYVMPTTPMLTMLDMLRYRKERFFKSTGTRART